MTRADHTRLAGPGLWAARSVWMLLMLLLLVTFLAALPAFFDDLRNLTYAGQTFGWSVETMQAALNEIGMSPGGYAALLIAVAAPFSLSFFATAIVIFWLRSDDWMALLVSLTLAAVGWSLFTVPQSMLDSNPELAPLLQLLGGIASISLPFVVYLFPNGRFVPRWTRFIAILALGDIMFVVAFDQIAAVSWLVAVFTAISVLRFIIFVAAPIYRYRRAATAIEQQQLKWIVLAIVVSLLSIIVAFAFRLVLELLVGGPENLQGTGVELLYYLIAGAIVTLVLMTVPVSITFAMAHYRLWDIDLIIRRTLVYGLVTSVLGVIYVGSITLLQSAVVQIMGTSSPLVLVVSTLATVALFAPVRSRVQSFVDRRFNRSHYDAARTLQDFGDIARDEVDLEKLEAALLGMVSQTMQPRHASLWVNEPAVSGIHAAHSRTTDR